MKLKQVDRETVNKFFSAVDKLTSGHFHFKTVENNARYIVSNLTSMGESFGIRVEVKIELDCELHLILIGKDFYSTHRLLSPRVICSSNNVHVEHYVHQVFTSHFSLYAEHFRKHAE